jgi:hypothetical protein
MPPSDVTGPRAMPEASAPMREPIREPMRDKAPVLHERIAAAFGGAATIDQVKDLLAELTAAIAAADQAAALAKARALDPVTMDIVTARRAQDDAAFTAERLRTALPKLQERLRELQAAAEDARRRVAFEQARQTRDALAVELAEVYPVLADRLVALLSRLARSDAAIETANANRPRGEAPLLPAELRARGLDNFARPLGPDIPRLTHATRLVSFEIADGLYAWPPPEPRRPADFWVTPRRPKAVA